MSFARLVSLVSGGDVVVLSGAGLSTESGIPDYRGPTGQARNAQPMTYQTFVGSAQARTRYWARSHAGRLAIEQARPNAGHLAVAELERAGLVTGIITQNVDGLHQAAGARHVIELHGGLDRVRCLNCSRRTRRAELDRRLAAANPGWDRLVGTINPDGDADLSAERIAGFRPVDCLACGGVLKPDVIFFGENVPKPRVEECFGLVAAASALLVLGSSLAVESGYRFVRRAVAVGTPVLIVNQGPTRGDAGAQVTLDVPLGATLSALVSRVSGLGARTP